MFNLDILDKLIAVVVILLVLSLIVQSIQAALKKLFRVKSLQLEQSLTHLFYYALGRDSLKAMKSVSDQMPLLRALYSIPGLNRLLGDRSKPLAARDSQVNALYKAVSTEFMRAGRISPRGKLLLESVSKADLVKFIGRIRIDGLIKRVSDYDLDQLSEINQKVLGAQTAVKDLCDKHRKLIEKTPLAEIEGPLLQLFENASQFLDSRESGVTVEDMARFGSSEIGEARKLLKALPDSVEETIAKLKDGAQTDAAEAFQKLNETLAPLRDELDAVVALPRKLGRLSENVDNWFETIMQSFEERYVRSMKSFTLVISFVVVVLLNANLLGIYREISANEAKRNLIVQTGEQLNRSLREQPAANTEQINQTLNQWAKQSYEQIEKDASLYTALGFDGPQWILDIPNRLRTSTASDVIETIIGWALMTMLLSVGAPFWQDTLQSLFGLKNLLRRRKAPGGASESTWR
jgi:hypothetical protein